MGLKTIIIAAVTILAVGGGVYYVTSSNKDGAQQSSESQTTNQESSSKLASIKTLLQEGKNVQCTFDGEDSGERAEGTIYIANERMRGDFAVTDSSGKKTTSHMINDGQYQYFWEEGEGEGFKMNIENIDTSNTQNDEQRNESIDQNKEYNFDCSDWSVDESRFQAPSDVEFTDFSAQLEQARQMQQNTDNQRKKACAQIPDSTARAACENAGN